MKACEKCNSDTEKQTLRAVDSHNNLVQYVCKSCGHSVKQIEPIDGE